MCVKCKQFTSVGGARVRPRSDSHLESGKDKGCWKVHVHEQLICVGQGMSPHILSSAFLFEGVGSIANNSVLGSVRRKLPGIEKGSA